MYTANTMASAIEVLNITESSAQEISSDKNDCERAEQLSWMITNLKPSDIVSKKSFENVITVVIALGGSTSGTSSARNGSMR